MSKKTKSIEWSHPDDRPEIEEGMYVIPQIGVKPSKLDSTKWMDKAYEEVEENFNSDALKVISDE